MKNLGIRDSSGYGNRNAEFAPVKYARPPRLKAEPMAGRLRRCLHKFHGVKKSEIRDIKYRRTWDIIAAAEKGLLPDKVMLNVHPQRWTDRPLPWVSPSETLLRRMPSACFTE